MILLSELELLMLKTARSRHADKWNEKGKNYYDVFYNYFLFTLGPLPSPDLLSPDKPSTPRSEKASTLYVTLPSVPSPDRTDWMTPLQPYGKQPFPGIPFRFTNYMRDTPSPIASEDFVSISFHFIYLFNNLGTNAQLQPHMALARN